MASYSKGRGTRRSYGGSRRGYGRAAPARRTRSRAGSRRSGNSGGTMRLVIEHVAASPISRSPLDVEGDKPSKAKL